MFGRYFATDISDEVPQGRGFDSFELRLGDVMRGERATLGKSLLDVQRDLRIKAAYIAAIEDCDTSAFETPGFIAGYVRSYARYLGMEPEETFQLFCVESGFEGVHGAGKSLNGEARAKPAPNAPITSGNADVIARAKGPFVKQSSPVFGSVDPGALGSVAVLTLLMAGIGFGGWTVFQEIQRVQVAPVEQAPDVIAQLVDPLSGAIATDAPIAIAGRQAPSVEALDRLYRPDPLDVPVLVARDAPISTIRPGAIGALAGPDAPEVFTQSATPTLGAQVAGLTLPGGPEPDIAVGPQVPQVVAEPVDEVILFAVRPAWVRVSAGDGSVLFERILDAGDSYTVPRAAAASTLHAGNSGSVYFRLNGNTYGPVGQGTSVARGVVLEPESVRETYAVADLTADRDLATVVAELSVPAPESPATE